MKFKCVCNSDMKIKKHSKTDKLVKKKDDIGIEREEFIVLRTYNCPKCERVLDTIEYEDVPPRITINTPDKDIKESYFNPRRYKITLREVLKENKDSEKVIKQIFNDWLIKCDAEVYEKRYVYSLEELINFTVEKLLEYTSKKEAIKYLAMIDAGLLEKYPDLTQEFA